MSVEVQQSDKENAHLLAGRIAMLTGTQFVGDGVAQAFYEVMALHRRAAEEAMRERCAKVAFAQKVDRDAAEIIQAAIRGMEVE